MSSSTWYGVHAARRRLGAAVTANVVDPDRADRRRASRTGAPRGPPRAARGTVVHRGRQSNVPAQMNAGTARPGRQRLAPTSSRKKNAAPAPPPPAQALCLGVHRDRQGVRTPRPGWPGRSSSREPGFGPARAPTRVMTRRNVRRAPLSTIQEAGSGSPSSKSPLTTRFVVSAPPRG